MIFFTVLWRSLLAFVTLLTIARVLGNQQISQMTFFTYVVGIAIGNIAGSLSSNLMEEPQIQFAALVGWGALAYSVGIGAIKNLGFRAVVEGEPVLVMRDGQILEKNMAKAYLNLNELLMLLRNQQVFDPAEVDIAILETNGNLSVLLKKQYQPVVKGGPYFNRCDGGKQEVPTEVVVDGLILDENLAAIGRDKAWLSAQLSAKGVGDVKQVSLAMVVPSGQVFVDLKSAQDAKGHT